MGRLLQRLCPHWWTGNVHWRDFEFQLMYEVVDREKCLMCGKRRVYAKVGEPHPTRDKQELVERLQQPGFEFIVDEWMPYGTYGPPSRDST